MANEPLSGQDQADPHVERGFDKRIIFVMIAAAIVFLLVFLYLTGMFSQQNSKGTNSNTQQRNQPSNP